MFKLFSDTIHNKYESMVKKDKELGKITLFNKLADKNIIKEKYLSSFPEGTNPIYKERTEHDCTCCTNFIRNLGTVVQVLADGTIDTVWNIDEDESLGFYNIVARNMHEYILSLPFKGILYTQFKTYGNESTKQLLEDGSIIIWDHFYGTTPKKYLDIPVDTSIHQFNTTLSMLDRFINTNIDSISIVLELIEENSIYRGEEFKKQVQEAYRVLGSLKDNPSIENRVFIVANTHISITRILNSVIGTLISDIDSGILLEEAVKAYEAKVAPSNYKRPKSIVTKAMLEKASKDIEELGLTETLQRRHTEFNDISVNDVLYVDKTVTLKEVNPVLDLLGETYSEDVLNIEFDKNKVPKIDINTFLKDVLPKTKSLYVQTKDTSKMVMSTSDTDKKLFKWNNNFSWAYDGNLTDSDITANVKAKGGKTEGVMRFSIQWNEDNEDIIDLDAHAKTPQGEISFRRMKIAYGELDIDITQPKGTAVENIVFSRLEAGKYRFFIDLYSGHKPIKGARAEVLLDGTLYSYNITNFDKNNMYVAEVIVDKKGNHTIKHLAPLVNTDSKNEFVRVSAVTLSPNYWGDNSIGNKHYFFLTKDFKQETPFRGIFNEFLDSSLEKHKKAFELIGSKLQVQPKEHGIVGYGYSSTKEDEIYVKADSKLFKIKLK